MKLASKGLLEPPFNCNFPWEESTFVQCGDDGVVFSTKKSYHTAFFEAFPKSPDCFLRGEGATIEEAEQKCWQYYQNVLNCKTHEFEAGKYINGEGICKHCRLFQTDVLTPKFNCLECNLPLNHANGGNWHNYCKNHYLKRDESKPYRLEMSYLIASNISSAKSLIANDKLLISDMQKDSYQNKIKKDIEEFVTYYGTEQELNSLVEQYTENQSKFWETYELLKVAASNKQS